MEISPYYYESEMISCEKNNKKISYVSSFQLYITLWFFMRNGGRK